MEALSGADRQRAYRRNNYKKSIDVSDAALQQIRVARDATGWGTDLVVIAAFSAWDEMNRLQRAVQRHLGRTDNAVKILEAALTLVTADEMAALVPPPPPQPDEDTAVAPKATTGKPDAQSRAMPDQASLKLTTLLWGALLPDLQRLLGDGDAKAFAEAVAHRAEWLVSRHPALWTRLLLEMRPKLAVEWAEWGGDNGNLKVEFRVERSWPVGPVQCRTIGVTVACRPRGGERRAIPAVFKDAALPDGSKRDGVISVADLASSLGVTG